MPFQLLFAVGSHESKTDFGVKTEIYMSVTTPSGAAGSK